MREKLGRAVNMKRWDMNETLRIIILDDLREWQLPFRIIAKTLILGHRYRNGPLGATALHMNDDIFLQDFIVLKGFGTALKHVYMSECDALKQPLTKRAVISAVTEATRDDCNNLSIL